MQSSPKPKCPNCGGNDTKCVSVEPIYPPEDKSRLKPVARVLAFRCACGHGFSVKVEEPVTGPRY